MTASAEPSWRIGVDVGGTFTDLAMVDESGRLSVHKVPSVPSDPAQGVFDVVARAAAAEGITVEALLAGTTLFVHGSTVATNTVLEGTGAKTGLLTTEGFRDFLEIRRGQRSNPWEHRTPYPPPLVPRHLRRPVRGRLDRDGREIEPLSAADVVQAAARFRQDGVEAVAICLFNSFLDPRQEIEAAAILRREMGDAFISASGAVSPTMGEYERGSTAVLNAFVAPRTIGYLTALDRGLAERGLGASLLLIQNNGGAVSVHELGDNPLTLLLSGPAAGVGALAHYAEALGTRDLVSMEIGGTSCDVILMAAGEVAFNDRLEIANHVCISPSVEVHTIGAGGGTIGHVDEAGLLGVGPRGAGARPGPACFGLGGTRATITDAQVVLGRLAPGPYAGGTVAISADLAERAIAAGIAEPLGVTIEAAAAGMIRLMDQKLLQAVQTLSTERGHDPRRFSLVAGGGAGPLHGAAVGRALGCGRVFMPRLSGAFCALGMLNSDVRHDLSRPFFGEIADFDAEVLRVLLAELEDTVSGKLAREGFAAHRVTTGYALDMRYVGQQWDLTVKVAAGFDRTRIRADFEAEHERLFGHHQPDGAIEITKARVMGVGLLPALQVVRPSPAAGEPAPVATRRVWLDPEAGWRDTPVFAGSALAPGHRIAGPAIVNEATTTILVGANDTLAVESSGNFVVTFAAAA